MKKKYKLIQATGVLGTRFGTYTPETVYEIDVENFNKTLLDAYFSVVDENKAEETNTNTKKQAKKAKTEIEVGE